MRKPLASSLANLKSKVQQRIICTDSNIYDIIHREIKRLGNKADLNHLDVSGVTSMPELFAGSYFNGDISLWDVSKVKNMASMFNSSQFNQDISQWDVSSVKSMDNMFAYSSFNQDISNWQINPKCDCSDMFIDCPIKSKYKPKLP